jgi:hypothetical protein
MRDLRRLHSLVMLAKTKEPTKQDLRDLIIALADEVIYLQRELDRINHLANRADRNARMGGSFR